MVIHNNRIEEVGKGDKRRGGIAETADLLCQHCEPHLHRTLYGIDLKLSRETSVHRAVPDLSDKHDAVSGAYRSAAEQLIDHAGVPPFRLRSGIFFRLGTLPVDSGLIDVQISGYQDTVRGNFLPRLQKHDISDHHLADRNGEQDASPAHTARLILRFPLETDKSRLAPVFRKRGYERRKKHGCGDSRRLKPVLRAEHDQHIHCQRRQKDFDDRVSEALEIFSEKAFPLLSCKGIGSVLYSGLLHLRVAQPRNMRRRTRRRFRHRHIYSSESIYH